MSTGWVLGYRREGRGHRPALQWGGGGVEAELIPGDLWTHADHLPPVPSATLMGKPPHGWEN